MATNAKVALLAVTYALALQQFYSCAGEHTVLKITASEPTFPLAIRDAVEKSAAGKKLAAAVKAWKAKLPKKPDQVWAWMQKQTPVTINNLLAVCVATSVDLVQVNDSDAKPAAAEITKAIKLDMAEFWEVTEDNYFTRVPRKHLLAELGTAIKPTLKKKFEGMKRDVVGKALVTELKGRRWLPPIMRNE